jgi:hypothetical protein
VEGHPGLSLDVVPLLRDVFPQGNGEFLMHCRLEVREAFTVGGGELYQVTVRHHTTTLGIDMALGVDYLEKATADLQRLDVRAESPGEKTVEYVLNTPLNGAFGHE